MTPIRFGYPTCPPIKLTKYNKITPNTPLRSIFKGHLNNFKIINNNEFINEVENKDGLVVVDFFATWCGPCKMLSPIYEALGNEMVEKANFLKVDIDQSIELAQKFEVSTVPTMIIFKDGKPVETLIGFMPKNKIEMQVKSYL